MLQSTQYNAEPVSGWMPAGGEATSSKASAGMEEAPLHSFDLQSLTCEVTLIDQAIAESGMADEFDLSQQDMRRLAVSANALMAVAVCAATDDEFAHLLSSFEPPRRIEEVGFLFGYAEHVRQQLPRGDPPREHASGLTATPRGAQAGARRLERRDRSECSKPGAQAWGVTRRAAPHLVC